MSFKGGMQDIVDEVYKALEAAEDVDWSRMVGGSCQ
jgi:hypothetical protein